MLGLLASLVDEINSKSTNSSPSISKSAGESKSTIYESVRIPTTTSSLPNSSGESPFSAELLSLKSSLEASKIRATESNSTSYSIGRDTMNSLGGSKGNEDGTYSGRLSVKSSLVSSGQCSRSSEYGVSNGSNTPSFSIGDIDADTSGLSNNGGVYIKTSGQSMHVTNSIERNESRGSKSVTLSFNENNTEDSTRSSIDNEETVSKQTITESSTECFAGNRIEDSKASSPEKTIESFRESVFTESLADVIGDIVLLTDRDTPTMGVANSPIYSNAYTVDRYSKSYAALSAESERRIDEQHNDLLQELDEINQHHNMVNIAEVTSNACTGLTSCLGIRADRTDQAEKTKDTKENNVDKMDAAEDEESEVADNSKYLSKPYRDFHSPDNIYKSLIGRATTQSVDYSSLRPRQSEPFSVSALETLEHGDPEMLLSFDSGSGPLQPLLDKVKERSSMSVIDHGNFGKDISDFLEDICSTKNVALVSFSLLIYS